MDASIVEVPTQTVLGIRKKGKFQEIATIIPALCEHAMKSGVQLVGPPVFICHEKNAEKAQKANAEGKADMEIMIPVAGGAKGTKEIKSYSLKGGRMAKIVHKGPYSSVGATYGALFAYIAQNKLRIVGAPREYYVSDPNKVKDEDLITEICVPVR